MQVCTSLQTDNHASTPPPSFFTGRMLFLPPNQQRQALKASSCAAVEKISTDTAHRAVRLQLLVVSGIVSSAVTSSAVTTSCRARPGRNTAPP